MFIMQFHFKALLSQKATVLNGQISHDAYPAIIVALIDQLAQYDLAPIQKLELLYWVCHQLKNAVMRYSVTRQDFEIFASIVQSLPVTAENYQLCMKYTFDELSDDVLFAWLILELFPNQNRVVSATYRSEWVAHVRNFSMNEINNLIIRNDYFATVLLILVAPSELRAQLTSAMRTTPRVTAEAQGASQRTSVSEQAESMRWLASLITSDAKPRDIEILEHVALLLSGGVFADYRFDDADFKRLAAQSSYWPLLQSCNITSEQHVYLRIQRDSSRRVLAEACSSNLQTHDLQTAINASSMQLSC